METIAISKVLDSIKRPWEPHDLAVANNTAVRVARLDGEFPWHHHDEDELFLCWSGEFTIELESRDSVALSTGDIFVVPAGVEHRPIAKTEAITLLLERPETKQYGNG